MTVLRTCPINRQTPLVITIHPETRQRSRRACERSIESPNRLKQTPWVENYSTGLTPTASTIHPFFDGNGFELAVYRTPRSSIVTDCFSWWSVPTSLNPCR